MHGGNIYDKKVNMDFSVNINPLDVPASILDAMKKGIDLCNNYPDPCCNELRTSISSLFNTNKDNIVIGNGASELLFAVTRSIMPKRAVLFAPCFLGYEHALNSVNCKIFYYNTLFDNNFVPAEDALLYIKECKPDVVFFCNPCNPTGVIMNRDYLIKIAKLCDENGIYFIVDECFMELSLMKDECSLIENLNEFSNLFIIRAFTKSFSIPGVRLGYMLCSKNNAENVIKQLPEWNVSIPAQWAGIEALKHTDYIFNAATIISKERQILSNSLLKMGFSVIPSNANFILFKCHKSDLYYKLLNKGILIRDCSDFYGLKPGFFRIAVRKKEENDLLINAIKECINE